MVATTPPTSASVQRIPSLDGIRGAAVLTVVIYHAVVFSGFVTHSRSDAVFNTVVKTGWAGVDLFFVLSGFLITGILYDSRWDNHYFRTFYIRRFLRIVPVYYAFLLVYLAIGALVIPATEAPRMSWSALGWAASYASNYPTGWQGWGILPHPVRHVWSLAVEEQFYLLWPVLVYRLPARRLLTLCIAVVVSGWLVRAALLLRNQDIASYVWTPARIGSLALGGYVAIAMRDPRLISRLQRWAAPAGGCAVMIILATLVWQRNLSYTAPATQLVVFDALAILFASIVLLAATARVESPVYRVLTSPLLRSFGKFSYAMYLFHQPLILTLIGVGLTATTFPLIAGSAWPAALAFALSAIAASYTVAFLSWHLLEKHCLRLKHRFTYGTVDDGAGAPVGHWLSSSQRASNANNSTPLTAGSVYTRPVAK